MRDYMTQAGASPSRAGAEHAEPGPGKRTLTEMFSSGGGVVSTFVTPGIKLEAAPPKAGPLTDTMGVSAHPQTKTEHGDIDGVLGGDSCPYAFVFGGRTGAAPGWIFGGNGGHGNEFVGSAITVAPQYDSDVHQGQGRAWIRALTGLIVVPRSYTGITGGAMPNGWYVTPMAIQRIDQHELLHVNMSHMLHNMHLAPLEARIAGRTGQANALVHGATAAEAVLALQAQIAWNPSLLQFYNADVAMNIPYGGVDMADVMSGTYPVDLGPRVIWGTPYAHVFGVPNDPFIQALDSTTVGESGRKDDGKGGGRGGSGGSGGGGSTTTSKQGHTGVATTGVTMEVS